MYQINNTAQTIPLTVFILVAGLSMNCASDPLPTRGIAEIKDDYPTKRGKGTVEREERNRLVILTGDPKTPSLPGIGVSISLGQEINPSIFSAGEPVNLYGSFNADMDLIKICPLGVENSILLTIVATDRPWGETALLIESQIQSERPPIDENTPYDPTYREGGQFKVDLVRFFDLPKSAGKYTINASVGPYFSDSLDLHIKATNNR